MRVAIATMLLALSGCDPEEQPVVAQTPPVLSVERYFPLHPGDRWVYRTDGTRVASGVSGVDARGIAVIVDDARSPVTRMRVTTTRAEITDPDGRALTPLLVAPITRGAEWSFTPDTTTSCAARIARTDVRERRAQNVSFRACVEVETRCAIGGASGSERRHHVRTDTYCPDVGRVRMRSRFEPPLAEAPHDVTSELVAWRVAGGPAPRSFRARGGSCDDVILLPSDFAAACGTSIEPAVPFVSASEGACAFTMRAQDGFVRVEAFAPRASVSVLAFDAGVASPHAATLDVSGVRFALSATEQACAPASLSRLAPLLRSLVTP